jgi:hypothetical protein
VAKTYRIDPDDIKPRNPVTRAMLRAVKGTTVHGRTGKAVRRASRVLTEREARAMFAALDYAREMED